MDNEMPKHERWMHNKWRPAIGWLYFVVVLFDFVIAPVVFSAGQFFASQGLEQWNPITLKGGGLFHVSMLGIVGVTAYGRTKEKLQQMGKDIRLDK